MSTAWFLIYWCSTQKYFEKDIDTDTKFNWRTLIQEMSSAKANVTLVPPPPEDSFNHPHIFAYTDSRRNSGGSLFEAIRKRRFRQVILLVEGGADPNCRNERGETPLIFCCRRLSDPKTRLKFVRFFLKAGVDPNVRDHEGMTALIHATILGLTQVVLLLLEYGRTDPEVQDIDGYNALMHAAALGHAEIVAFFLNRRLLHPDSINNAGNTAFHIAVKNKHDACAKLLARETERLAESSLAEDTNGKNRKERHPTPIPSSISPSLARRGSDITTIDENSVVNDFHYDEELIEAETFNNRLKLPEIAITRIIKSSGCTLSDMVKKSISRKKLDADNRSLTDVPFLNNLLQMQNLSVSEETISETKMAAEESSIRSGLKRPDSQDFFLPPIRGRLLSYDDIYKTAPFIHASNE